MTSAVSALTSIVSACVTHDAQTGLSDGGLRGWRGKCAAVLPRARARMERRRRRSIWRRSIAHHAQADGGAPARNGGGGRLRLCAGHLIGCLFLFLSRLCTALPSWLYVRAAAAAAQSRTTIWKRLRLRLALAARTHARGCPGQTAATRSARSARAYTRRQATQTALPCQPRAEQADAHARTSVPLAKARLRAGAKLGPVHSAGDLRRAASEPPPPRTRMPCAADRARELTCSAQRTARSASAARESAAIAGWRSRTMVTHTER